jgi:hypothetical protein
VPRRGTWDYELLARDAAKRCVTTLGNSEFRASAGTASGYCDTDDTAA